MDRSETAQHTVAPDHAALRRANRAFGPILAGLIIDGVDLATFGPIGVFVGLPIGGAAGFWMGKCLGLRTWPCVLCGLVAGIYCMIPFTEALPLATIAGAYARFMESAPAGAASKARQQDSATAQPLESPESKSGETGDGFARSNGPESANFS